MFYRKIRLKMLNKTANISEKQRSLTINPASLNAENRTVEVVFATETPVLSRDWNISERNDGLYWEILSCSDKNVRMDRLKNGAPVLDGHGRGSMLFQYGVVDNARIEKNEGIATIRFSKRANVEPIWGDIVDKIFQNISSGYRVYKYEAAASMGTDQIPIFRAVDWEPTEISLTPVQADPNSKVRDQNQNVNQVEIINLTNRTMPEEVNVPATVEITPVEGTRAANTAPAPATAAPAPVNAEAERTAAIQAERTRSMEIIETVRSAKLDQSFADKLIKDGIPIDQARKLVIDEFAKEDPNAGANNHVRSVTDESDKVRACVSDALILRCDPSQEKKMKPEEVSAAREFRGRSLIDITRNVAERAGIKTGMMSDREMITRALSTSDLPVIFASTVNRTLRAAYDEAPRTFTPFCRKVTMRDFRSITRAQLSSLPTLSLVKEGGEYTYGKLADAKEVYSLAKYGEIVPITWESIINDDLDAFSRIPIMLANAAAQKQSDIVYGILIDNGNMGDGVALFEASSHANYAASGTTIANGMPAAKAAMRKQKGLGAAGTKATGFYLNLEPKFLIVGPDKEVEAMQLLKAVIVPVGTSTANVFFGTMEPIIEPRISGNAWYLSAAPGRIDTIEYAFLDGEPEMFTERKLGFETDGLDIKVRMVFAAKAIDHRGLYKNVGA
jgi:hypothetical protein